MKNNSEADQPIDEIIEISDVPEPSTQSGNVGELDDPTDPYLEAKSFLEDLEESPEYEKESLIERRLDEAVDLLRKNQKELEVKEEKIGDLESALRSHRRKFRKAMLSIFFLTLFASGMTYKALKNNRGQQNIPVEDKKNERPDSVSEVITSSTVSVPKIMEKIENERLIGLAKTLENLQKELDKSNKRIVEIDEWIALQTNDYWRNKGIERRNTWINYLQYTQQQIISVQDEMIRLLKEERPENGK